MMRQRLRTMGMDDCILLGVLLCRAYAQENAAQSTTMAHMRCLLSRAGSYDNQYNRDVGRSDFGDIAIRTRKINFKTGHMPLSSRMLTVKPSKNSLLSPLLLIPIKVPCSPTFPPHRVKSLFPRGMGEVGRECILLICQLDRLKLAIDQKWPESANRGVLFHQDNFSLHASVVTHQNLWELGWEVLMHPPYSPDLAPAITTFFFH
ncbi:transposase [Trichonephila clavipes]|nr:transposase [Trichonephila clavipes]